MYSGFFIFALILSRFRCSTVLRLLKLFILVSNQFKKNKVHRDALMCVPVLPGDVWASIMLHIAGYSAMRSFGCVDSLTQQLVRTYLLKGEQTHLFGSHLSISLQWKGDGWTFQCHYKQNVYTAILPIIFWHPDRMIGYALTRDKLPCEERVFVMQSIDGRNIGFSLPWSKWSYHTGDVFNDITSFVMR